MGKTLYGEARGEGDTGMRAVAHVILNRVAKKGWMGKTISEVCLKPYQFSVWNEDQIHLLTNVTLSLRHLRKACKIALETIDEKHDITFGSTHYHHKDISPAWAQGHTPVFTHKNHVFYVLE